MSQEAVTQFNLLTEKLLRDRKASGGLSMEEEYKRTCELGDMWEQMTDAEQNEIEAQWATRPTEIP